MRRFLPLLILVSLATGCSRRERANPLDPANPQTGGRPEGFASVAEYGAVALSWNARPDLAIDGFQLLRLAAGDSVYRPLAGLLVPEASSFLDGDVVNGGTYAYRLHYVIGGRLSATPASDHATPGPLRPWVADAAGALVRLSPDGRHVVERFRDAGQTQCVTVDRASGRVWTSSSIDGLVTARDPGGFAPALITGISQPFEIAVTPYDGSAWICDLAGDVAHYDGNGLPVSPAQLSLLDLPSGVAVDPRDYSVWVCENGGSRVRHYTLNGNAIATTFVPRPSRVAVDSLTQVAWVTCSGLGRIWRIAPNGALLDSLVVATAPLGIAIDRAHGRVWVTDAAADRVLAIDLATRAVLFTVPGIAEPRGVAVDVVSGDAWVVARVDGAVYRISKDGVVLERCGGFTDPYEIGLDPGTP